jgi:drug/metabolite transporter (DMT)-like permease
MVSVRTISDRLIPWMWGINGLAVVFGGAALALGSYFFGFRAALAAAAACYAAAAVLLPRKRNPSS